MNRKRVVVTGYGTITPYGIGTDVLWNSVISGKSAIDTLTKIDLENQTVKIGGEIKDFDRTPYGNPKEVKRYSNMVMYAVVASDEAIKMSKLDLEKEDLSRFGVIIGSGASCLPTVEHAHIQMLERGYNKCSPFTIPMMISNMPAGIIAIKYGFKGINKAIVSACASGNHSIGDAFRAIQYGEADVIVTGGTESAVCDFGISGFSCAKTLSKRNEEPQKASRPFDKDRDGFVMSEGSGVLVLEEYQHAIKRGAKIYSEIVGYGQNCDAYDMVSPNPEGIEASNAMKLALKDAEIDEKDINYINTHGTSTHLGDIAESKAIERVFGDKQENKNLLVSSTKSMLGHSLGATAAIEAIICIKTQEYNIVPPTINLENQDEEVADLDYVPNFAREHKVNYAMNNSFGFGGCNAVLIFKKS